MVSQSSHCPAFSINEARSIISNLFTPRPLIYWVDFLGSMGLGAACFAGMRQSDFPTSPWFWLFYCGTVLFYYRAVLFTHEMTHFRKGTFGGFRIAWNLLCGIPFLVPSFTYDTHLAHHTRKHYGTHEDGEYLPLSNGPWWLLGMVLVEPLLMPFVAIVRFLILAPLGWISPRVREFNYKHLSSMVIDPTYVRPLPTNNEQRLWRLQEIGCYLYILGVIALLASGIFPLVFLARVYGIAIGILTLNTIRTLGAHRFRNTGGEMNFTEQLLDSVNYPSGSILTELWAPVGLRYHALHHLFPSLPYHALPEAHARLMQQLPADSPYRLTNSPSLLLSLRELVRGSQQASRARQVRRTYQFDNSRQPMKMS